MGCSLLLPVLDKEPRLLGKGPPLGGVDGSLGGAGLPDGVAGGDALADGSEAEEIEGGAPRDLAAWAGVVSGAPARRGRGGGGGGGVHGDELFTRGEARGVAGNEGAVGEGGVRGRERGARGRSGGEGGQEVGEIRKGVAYRGHFPAGDGEADARDTLAPLARGRGVKGREGEKKREKNDTYSRMPMTLGSVL